jgi:pimeloyl-ACP methyl ester carboxylesterase
MAGEKPTLVLLAGLLNDDALWRHQIDNLGDVADVIVGETRSDEDIHAMAERVLAEAPDSFALAGLSMGGYCAFEILSYAPERISRLALLDTTARADDPDRMAWRRNFLDSAEGGDFSAIKRQSLEAYIHPSRYDDPSLMAEFDAMAERVGLDTYVRQQKAIMSRKDRRYLLGDIDVPTIVICGREDKATPLPWNVEIAEAIPGAQLHVVERAGHLTPMERPEEVTAVLRDWLTA